MTRTIRGFITSRQVRRLILIELKGFDQQTTILQGNRSGGAKDRAYQVDQNSSLNQHQYDTNMVQNDNKTNQDLAQEQKMKVTVQLIMATHTIFLRLRHILILLEVGGVYECLIV